jgi:hypothetical protein
LYGKTPPSLNYSLVCYSVIFIRKFSFWLKFMLMTWAKNLPKLIFKNIWLYFNHIFLIIYFLKLMNNIVLTCINNRKYCIKLILIKLTLIHGQISNSVENILMHKQSSLSWCLACFLQVTTIISLNCSPWS